MASVLVCAAYLLCATLASCGPDVEYYADGVRRAEGHVSARNATAQSRETGAWTWWYPNGERRERGTLEDGARTGTWTQWYPNGQRRSEGRRAWDAATHSSQRVGLWTFWHENGERLARGVYRTGRREGHWDYSLDNGALDGDRTGEYHDDARVE